MKQTRSRWPSAFAFVCSSVVLAMAAWLTPAAEGVGTHTQLGLEPCVLLSAFGLPCPMCGMTTTFALMADLRVLDAFLNQPFGVLLFLVTVVIAIVSGLEILSPANRWAAITLGINERKPWFILVLSVGFFGGWIQKIFLIT